MCVCVCVCVYVCVSVCVSVCMLVCVWYTEPTCIPYWASRTDIVGQVLSPSMTVLTDGGATPIAGRP